MVLYGEDIMNTDCQIVDGNISAYEASLIMSENRNGYIIIGTGKTPSGIVTEWDFVNRVVSKKLDPESVKLKEIMSAPLKSVPSNTPIKKLVDLMAKNSIRRLLVIDDGELRGVITARDILKFFDDYVSNIVEIAAKFGIS
ncbi:MAG: CBS domain-containing protein [Ferroplasma sp.]